MNAKNKGLLVGILTGTVAGAAAYLSLSKSDQEDMKEEVVTKVGEANVSAKEIGDRVIDFITEKIELSKEVLDDKSQAASQIVEESADSAKSRFDYYLDLASDFIDEHLKDYKR